MFRLSILLPVVGDHASFENTLVSVLENRPTSCEVIVIAPADYEDPYDLQDEVQLVRVSNRQPTWMTLANVGLTMARGAYVNLLLPGTEVLEQWDAAAIDRLQRTARTGAVTSLAIDDRAPDAARAIAGLACSGRGLRSYRYAAVRQDESARTVRVDGVPSWCGFFRRQDLLDVGGWDERLSESTADIDLALRLRRRGLASICEMASCVVWRKNVLASGLSARQRGQELEQLYWRHLARLRWSALLGYPWSWFVSLRNPSMLLGRLSAWQQSSPDWTVAEFVATTTQQIPPLPAQSRAA